MRKARFTLLILLVAFAMRVAIAQAQRPSPDDVEKRVDSLLSQMTLDEKIELIGGINSFYTRPIPRLGITSLKMSDGPLGVHDYGPTTAYAAGIDLAASWDTDLAHRVGVSMGRDARARGVNVVLAPGLNIYRAPMNGRNFEYFGEDPYLASRMAVSVVEGMQSQDVIATVKHFVANNMEYGRNDHSSDVDERTLREIYLPAFEAAVREAHVGAVMDSYNLVNGEHMTQNAHLNKEILKDEWGFDGILMSDWGATHDGIAAANGGLDLEMPSAEYMTPQVLIPAIKDGKVSMATIDDKVRRILRMGVRFGFFGHDQTDSNIPLYSQRGRELVREESRDGMVLLKNDGNLLPLDKTKLKTIAVIGPDAYPAVIGGGGSSLTQPYNQVSFLEGISNYLGTGVNVLTAVDSVPAATVAENTTFHTAPDGPVGLQAEYFDNQELAGPPSLKRVDPRVNFDWGDGSFADGHPVDHFSARWTAYYIPQTTGDYTFYASTDDGARLYLGNDRIINDWAPHSETLDTATRHLEAGHAYQVRLEYFEDGGGATARFGVINAADVIGRQTQSLAAKVDAVILCVGFDPTTESEGSDRTFRLPNDQDELISKIASVNKNVVVVVTAGGNVDMTGWLDRVPALLYAWYPGQEGGAALAQLLFGDFSPSGKLPASFERRWEDNPTFHNYYPQTDKRIAYNEGIFVGYRYYDRSSTKPLFPFGFGLSYTRFRYSNLKVSPGSSSSPDSVAVSFDVQNTGARAGAEVAELYVGDSHSSVPRPVKELKGFAKVFLQPGETKTVNLTLNRRSFSYYDVRNKRWTAEPGEFAILVGSSSERIELTGSFTLTK
ncbi:MAG TPA: glycoside hydrolase family 3 C-terminal domain-containing protein [Candidatus Limnocylindrales bacterium]|nr:glycoside hydrolase family 3 C-terminal domain-containing protein [Candidatus Limnocylindrales bacterium]